MNVKDRIRNTIERATQDYDGRDEIMLAALERIEGLEKCLSTIKDDFIRMGWKRNSIMIESIDEVLEAK